MSDNGIKTQSFKLKGRLYTLTVMQLIAPDLESFAIQCAEIVSKAPKFFERAPVVFDLSEVQDLEIDLQAFSAKAMTFGIVPVAIQSGTAFQETVAQCHGLAVLKASSSHDKSLLEDTVEMPSLQMVKSRLLTTPVRSGQQVVAVGSDLIVTSAVSHGAELLADGSIHVYGSLRGRALAGLSGDLDARIFCQSLDAELVSIAGFYRLSEAIEPMEGPCQIYLQDGHIHIEPL